MRIVIDMQGAQSEYSGQRGVGRYTLAMAKALEAIEHRHEIVYAFNGFFEHSIDRIARELGRSVPASRIKAWQQHFVFAGNDPHAQPRREAAEALRETFLDALAPDVIFLPNLQEGLTEPAATSVGTFATSAIVCSTLHDVIPLTDPQRYLADPITREWYQRKIADVRNSDLIITDSGASKSDILEHLTVEPDKLHVVPLGVDLKKFTRIAISDSEAKQLKNKFGIARGFILYVGGHDHHKNLDRLFAAYAGLARQTRKRFKLVLVGKEIANHRSQFEAKFEALKIADDVVVAGRAEENELVALLNLTDLFVFPSLHEGFGLPVLEAMACGAPVIASNAPSVREIIANPESIFDPYDVDDMQRRLQETLDDESYRSRISDHGLLRAADFSWEESARKLLKLLEQHHANRESTQGAAADASGLSLQPAVPSDDDAATRCALRISQMPSAHRLHDPDLQSIARSIAETFRPAQCTAAQLLLDVSTIINKDHESGIQRVVRAIGSELLKLESPDREVRLVWTTPDSSCLYRARSVEARWSGRRSGAPVSDTEIVELHDGDVLLYLDLHPRVAINQLAHTRRLARRGVRIFHVVYDLLPVLRPEFFWEELCTEFHEWLPAVAQSDGALCISRSVAQEFDEWLEAHQIPRGDRFDISWFHLGGDIANSAPSKGLPHDAALVLQQLNSGQTFLMVGTVEPRKGHWQTVEAFEQLWNDGRQVNLVIVGREGWRIQDIAHRIRSHPMQGRRLFWLEGISDEYLERVYANSSCLIAASHGEGFGLPLIEAAHHDLPIVARDLPVFREVVGDYALFFEGGKPSDLAQVLVEWMRLYETGEHPKPDGISSLTWSQSALRLAQIVAAPGLATDCATVAQSTLDSAVTSVELD